MPKQYSLYEAKAKLSALVRQVREGRSVVITVHGQPVAELRPIGVGNAAQTLAERLAELEERGELARPADAGGRLTVGKSKRGALKRFLDERE
jgi:prevent-host-death family protein